MPWGNSWSGGGQVVASSVQVVGSNGTVVASITPQGAISGTTVSANTDILLAGTSLTATLNGLPKGMVAQTSIPAADLPSASYGAAEGAVMELDATLSANRMYQVYLSNMELQTTSNHCRCVVRVRYTTDGTTPTTASPRLFETWVDLVDGGQNFAVVDTQSRVINFSSQVKLRLLMTSQNQIIDSGTQQSHQFIGLDTGTIPKAGAMMAINDLGPKVPDTGLYIGAGTGGSPTPTPVFKSFDTSTIDSQSFRGDGSASNGSGSTPQSFMYFGNDPGYPNGNWRSYAWWNIADTSGGNGLGSIADMAGISASNISYLDVWVFTDWWYAVAGGTLYLGWNNVPINHTQEPVGPGAYQAVAANYSSRGQGQWISVLGSSIQSAILANNFNSIVVGPGPTNSYGYYGYAAGWADSINHPQLRAGYWK